MSERRYIVNPTFRPQLMFTTRVKSEQIKPMQIDIAKLPQMANLLLKVAAARANGNVGGEEFQQHIDFLVQAGILISADVAPNEVAPRLPLSTSLLEFVPGKWRAEVPRDVSINREHVFIQTTTPRPETPWPGIPPWTGFPNELPLIWVFDPGTQMWAAYHADEANVSLIEKVDSTNGLDPQLRELLWHARIVIADDYLQSHIRHWDAALDTAHESIEQEGFAVLRQVISPLQIAAARQYARSLEREGYFQIDQQQRFYKHNDELFRFLHRQTGYLLRRVTRETIIPSYTYLSAYRENAELERHLDRPQCVWNASLLIDTNRDDDDGRTWPIFLDTINGQREIRLDLGDAVVHRGADVPHWRPQASEGERQTLVLLHYVPFDFTGSLD